MFAGHLLNADYIASVPINESTRERRTANMLMQRIWETFRKIDYHLRMYAETDDMGWVHDDLVDILADLQQEQEFREATAQSLLSDTK